MLICHPKSCLRLCHVRYLTVFCEHVFITNLVQSTDNKSAKYIPSTTTKLDKEAFNAKANAFVHNNLLFCVIQYITWYYGRCRHRSSGGRDDSNQL